jgi:hypothetical protein
MGKLLRDIVPRRVARKLFAQHSTLEALGALETRHLPHLATGALFEAMENAGVDDVLVDRFEQALEDPAVQAAFSLAGAARPLLSEEVVDIFMRAASPTSTMPNVIPIKELATCLEEDAKSWTVSPKLLNLAFCRLGAAGESLCGITAAVHVVMRARRRLTSTDAGLIVDLSVNELDDCEEARQCIASLAAHDDIAYIVILGQDLAKSVELHRTLFENRCLGKKVISLLHDAVVGVRFPGSQKLLDFAISTLAADVLAAYTSKRKDYEALHRSVQTPKQLAEAALDAALT